LRILQTAAPDNISIKAQVRRIESVISNRLIALFKQLGKTKNSSSEQQIRKIHLKILALTPNHNIAIEELRAYEWQYALEKAATKTQTIKEYFIENQVKAKRSIKLNQLLEQAEQFTQDRKYKDLLQLADKFEMAFPVNKKPAEFRLLAYTNLAERSIQKKDITMAISFFEKAIEIDNNQNTLLQTKNDGLKEQLAKSYMGLGLQVFKKDLDKAIDMFTLSLKYQPNNTAARQQLHRATRVRDNLNKIKKLNASSS
jgi:tetratricopeptide (TPR) repeat protein